MTEDKTSDGFGAKALMFAMIAGAALLFLEVTWSPAMQAMPAKTATVQTVTVAALPEHPAGN